MKGSCTLLILGLLVAASMPFAQGVIMHDHCDLFIPEDECIFIPTLADIGQFFFIICPQGSYWIYITNQAPAIVDGCDWIYPMGLWQERWVSLIVDEVDCDNSWVVIESVVPDLQGNYSIYDNGFNEWVFVYESVIADTGFHYVTVGATDGCDTSFCTFGIAVLAYENLVDLSAHDASMSVDIDVSDSYPLDELVEVTATFHNLGNDPVFDPQARIYLGDPLQGGQMVVDYTHQGFLDPGESVLFSGTMDMDQMAANDDYPDWLAQGLYLLVGVFLE